VTSGPDHFLKTLVFILAIDSVRFPDSDLDLNPQVSIGISISISVSTVSATSLRNLQG
jgi:hypothetical protein